MFVITDLWASLEFGIIGNVDIPLLLVPCCAKAPTLTFVSLKLANYALLDSNWIRSSRYDLMDGFLP